MFIEAHAARLEPANFDELVEELGGALIEIAELAAFILVELHVGMAHQHFANEQSRLGMRHLPAVIRRLHQPLRAIDVDGGGGPA